jgi:hypothetical protein
MLSACSTSAEKKEEKPKEEQTEKRRMPNLITGGLEAVAKMMKKS